jgi:hypothetical protein
LFDLFVLFRLVQDIAAAWSSRSGRGTDIGGQFDLPQVAMEQVNMGEVADAHLPARLAARLPDRGLGSSFSINV